MLLNDNAIRNLCFDGMIAPFEPAQVRSVAVVPGHKQRPTHTARTISYGVSSFGYDLRLAPSDFRVFSPHHAREIDPKAFDEASLVSTPAREADDGALYYLLPPHTYALGVTVETFAMPPDVLGICMGKSTYARCGLLVNTTPLEPGWKGRLVIELFNAANLPLRVYVGEGIAQCVFLQGEKPATSYADRGGKYQGQSGLTLARV